MRELVKLTLHLASGKTVETIFEPDAHDIGVEALTDLVARDLNNARGTWLANGHIAYFPGAVSAIEVDLLRSEEERKGSE